MLFTSLGLSKGGIASRETHHACPKDHFNHEYTTIKRIVSRAIQALVVILFSTEPRLGQRIMETQLTCGAISTNP